MNDDTTMKVPVRLPQDETASGVLEWTRLLPSGVTSEDKIKHAIGVCYQSDLFGAVAQRLIAALRARRLMIEHKVVKPTDPELLEDGAIVLLAYQRCLTELACWELVFKGELMVDATPRWAVPDDCRQHAFFTIENEPIVLDVKPEAH